MKKNTVKISDIAREMNLSEATISNAFTGKGRMKPETREEILACAARMGYRFRNRKNSTDSQSLIVIAESLGNSFMGNMLTGLLGEAAKHRLSLPIYSLQITDASRLRNPDISEINQTVTDLLSQIPGKVSGIIYLSQYARRLDGLLNDCSIPVISVFGSRDDGLAYIHYDDHQGAYLAVEKLVLEGRKKIAMISGPIDSIGMYLRSSGYQQALVEHQLPYDPRLVRIGDWDWRSGYESTLKLLSENRGIDAIFAQNDHIGLGAARAVREMGFSIPEDISIIGFDNSLPSQLSSPVLTSIRPPFEEMGRISLKRMLQMLEETNSAARDPSVPAVHRNPLLPCGIQIGESTL